MRDEAEDIRLELISLLGNWDEAQACLNLVRAKALSLRIQNLLEEKLLKEKGE